MAIYQTGALDGDQLNYGTGDTTGIKDDLGIFELEIATGVLDLEVSDLLGEHVVGLSLRNSEIIIDGESYNGDFYIGQKTGALNDSSFGGPKFSTAYYSGNFIIGRAYPSQPQLALYKDEILIDSDAEIIYLGSNGLGPIPPGDGLVYDDKVTVDSIRTLKSEISVNHSNYSPIEGVTRISDDKITIFSRQNFTDNGDIFTDNNIKASDISGDSIFFSEPPLNGFVSFPRRAYWDEDVNTLSIGMDGEVTLQVGQEQYYYVKAAEALSNGDVVYASGVVGGSSKIQGAKYIADGSIQELYVLGIATQDIALGEFGYVTEFGTVKHFTTTGANGETWNEGDILYASPTVAGALTNVQPIAPNLDISMAIITNEADNGAIFVRPTRGFHLNDLHDVHYPTTPATNELLRWGSSGRWENVTLTAGGGITISNTASDIDVSHTDTSSQASVNNSNGTVIQDVSLDTYGHITGLGSVDLDNRYYTQLQANSTFLTTTGIAADSDKLDGQQGSYYLNTSTNFGGDVSGPYNNIVVANDSHTHDGRYYTESEIQDFLDRGFIDSYTATNIAAGWYTIATVTQGRACARFALFDSSGGNHQSVIFYGSHHYGTDSSNTITVLNNSFFSGSPFRYIRIKDLSTYDGAAIQVYIDNSSNNVGVAILGDNVQKSTGQGWVIKNWVPDATDPGGVSITSNSTNGTTSAWSSFTEASKIDLDQIAQGGIVTTGPIYADGDLTQYKVLTTADEGAGNGLDADKLDGQDGSYYQPASTALTTSTNFGGDVSGPYNNIVIANDSHTHDGRYYTESESDSRFVNVTGDTMSGPLVINDDITVNGDAILNGDSYGIYHKLTEDQYYFDDYNGRRLMSTFQKSMRSDIIRYQPFDNIEYWNGSSWQDGSSQVGNIEKLLDGRDDTGWNVPSTYYKFRFTVTASTSWPTLAAIGLKTGWSSSSWPGCQMIIEELQNDGTTWTTKVTANFTNSNGIVHWGNMFIADSALHSGRGSQSQSTRITIDFYGWIPSNPSYTTIPLQNIFIYSNYSGTENTDYTNLLDYNKNVSLANNVYAPNIGTDTDNSVVILNSAGYLKTDEIDSRVWGSTLVDSSASASYIPKMADSNSLSNSNIYDNGTNIGIGTDSPASKLHLKQSSDSHTGSIKITESSDDNTWSIWQNPSSTLFFQHSSSSTSSPSSKFYITSNGDITNFGNATIANDLTVDTNTFHVDSTNNRVGVKTASPSYDLEVNGSFAATTKSFIIPHPTKEGKKLRYASLEGPENGVYIRGKSGADILELPEYWEKLVDEDSVTVTLTPIGKFQPLYVVSQSNKQIEIGGVEGEYNYVIYGERKDVEKLIVEVD